MDRLLDRLRSSTEEAASIEEDSSSRSDFKQSTSGETIEWRDITVQPDSTESSPPDHQLPEQELPARADTTAAEALTTDQSLRTVIDGVTTPALIVDSEGCVVYLNDLACEFFGTTRSVAIGTASTSLHVGTPLVPQVLATGEAVRNYRETVAVDATNYALSRTIVPFKTATGNVVGAMETVRGRTE